MLHQLNAADGEDVAPRAKFMPPNGKPYGLNLFNGAIYTHTAQGCGGNPNMVYASIWRRGRSEAGAPPAAACGAAAARPSVRPA
ncbi:MAG TPA: hypothetical protein VG273_04325 [Bryobacteraceae bacterium]|nr:hypothetical protein [Bryobacteraceae bacterium]